MSTDPVPDPTAPEAASRIGDILASAERQVTEILAQADRQAAEVHAESARLLQARRAELEEIAAGLVAAAQAAQEGLDRLHALQPLDLPATHGGPHGAPALAAGAPVTPAADERPVAGAPAQAAPAGAGPDHTVPNGAGPNDAGPVAPEAGARAADAGAHAAAEGNGASSSGGGILHRPAEWIGFGEPTGRPEPATGSAPHDAHGAAGAGDLGGGGDGANGERSGAEASGPSTVGASGPEGSPADGGPAVQAASPATQATPEELADMPIIAESDGAPYPQDPPEKIDSARLVALSMAANGRSREEVEAHVRDELGIVDHAALIDYVFGISAPSSIVPSWPPRRRRRGA
jgi:hypothetical protein